MPEKITSYKICAGDKEANFELAVMTTYLKRVNSIQKRYGFWL